MPDQRHLTMLLKGKDVWNRWRGDHPDIRPDLTRADVTGNLCGLPGLVDAVIGAGSIGDLRGLNLGGADLDYANLAGLDLRGCDFSRTQLARADLSSANMTGADLRTAVLRRADLQSANMHGCDLRLANLWGANLLGADLTEADLSGATLDSANLVESNLEDANLTGAGIYGVSVWGVRTNAKTQQQDLVIHSLDRFVRVDTLELAHLVYLLLEDNKFRDLVETMTSRVILILGRFTPERKRVLDGLRDELRKREYLPVVFDFERAAPRDLTETVMILAGLSAFVIADITSPRSSPLELQAAVPDWMIPFVPIIQEGEAAFPMFTDLRAKYDWVLKLLTYDSIELLLETIEESIIKPALEKRRELVMRKASALETRTVRQYSRRTA